MTVVVWVELGEMALQEGHPELAEPLVRSAITLFEKENGLPDASSAYVLLSRSLLMQRKLDGRGKHCVAPQNLARILRTPR